MSSKPPDFDQFAKWTALKFGARSGNPDRYDELLSAARAARDEMARAAEEPLPRNLEVLQLLAAASADEMARPPELTTARGFRVTLAYDEGESPDQSSICVLVQSPPEMIRYVQNETAYLWNGSERFELGQFDADGKAIGTLPAGVQISISDFASGNIKLEEPNYPTQD
ncbi:MAG: hypothetical protein ACLQBA_03755 [Candidatus Binataceae bacterium]